MSFKNGLDPRNKRNMKSSCCNCKFVFKHYESVHVGLGEVVTTMTVKCYRYYDGYGNPHPASKIRKANERCYSFKPRQ